MGAFPTLSTVTYLTASSSNAAPTLVFDHTYDQGEEEIIDTMLCSRPSLGKHLVFDGTLLHGAPANPLLKANIEESNNEVGDSPSSIRVTFLVNVWKDRKPSSVHTLESSIRQKLLVLDDSLVCLEKNLVIERQVVTKILLEKEEDIPEPLRQRIELPFVTKGITWEEQLCFSDDVAEDDGGLVVITFPPPQTHDTMLVTWEKGLQAYLDYSQKEENGHGIKGGQEERNDYYV